MLTGKRREQEGELEDIERVPPAVRCPQPCSPLLNSIQQKPILSSGHYERPLVHHMDAVQLKSQRPFTMLTM